MIVRELMEVLQACDLRSRGSCSLLISIIVRVSIIFNSNRKAYIELWDIPACPGGPLLRGEQGEPGNGRGRRDSLSY